MEKTLYKKLNQLEHLPLSNKEIKNLYNIPIITLKTLHNIFKNNEINQYVLFLPNKSSNVGHWVLISKINVNKWEYFDSYGNYPPYEVLNKIPKNLLLEYNTVQYQSKKSNINTCGHHVLFRAFTIKYMRFNLNEYYEFMKGLEDYDKSVIYFDRTFLNIIKYIN